MNFSDSWKMKEREEAIRLYNLALYRLEEIRRRINTNDNEELGNLLAITALVKRSEYNERKKQLDKMGVSQSERETPARVRRRINEDKQREREEQRIAARTGALKGLGQEISDHYI